LPFDWLWATPALWEGSQGVDHQHVQHRFGSVSKPCTPGEHQNSW
jgi:hypothetical protein